MRITASSSKADHRLAGEVERVAAEGAGRHEGGVPAWTNELASLSHLWVAALNRERAKEHSKGNDDYRRQGERATAPPSAGHKRLLDRPATDQSGGYCGWPRLRRLRRAKPAQRTLANEPQPARAFRNDARGNAVLRGAVAFALASGQQRDGRENPDQERCVERKASSEGQRDGYGAVPQTPVPLARPPDYDDSSARRDHQASAAVIALSASWMPSPTSPAVAAQCRGTRARAPGSHRCSSRVSGSGAVLS
jgi:hypothetical protein